jgi:hypothetical protein
MRTISIAFIVGIILTLGVSLAFLKLGKML